MKANRQSGFTLIEMVAVIVILAIMAATALPKFANLSGEARYSSLGGLVGGLHSAATLSKAKWVMAQSGSLDTIIFSTGVNVSVIATTTPGSATTTLGYPLGSSLGIEAAMDNLSASYTSGTLGNGDEEWWPTGVTASGLCYVKYQSGTVTIVPANGATAATDCG
jgi:MSHA pilin protein MshA